MKISIIIPVGNEAQWRVCRASLEASVAACRTPIEAEILPCFDLEHRGAYVARNEGLARVTGEWIAWVDCDDVVEPGWFPEIAAVIAAHPEADVVQFDATEVRDGAERAIRYCAAGSVTGDAFARELLRNDGMPAWLWTRVFRRELFADVTFEGREKEDYTVFLRILPRIRSVWSIGKPLYRYFKHGQGLSNYTQAMDYRAAGEGMLRLIDRLPRVWAHDARVGFALTMADVALHAPEDGGSRDWVRKYGCSVLMDPCVSLRLKAKCLLAMAGVRRCR